MPHFFYALVRAIVPILFFVGSAHAGSITYTFTATVLPGYGFDGLVSGYLTIPDLSQLDHFSSDGVTTAANYGISSPPQPAGVGGYLTVSNGIAVSVGGRSVYDRSDREIRKDGTENEYYVFERSVYPGNASTLIGLQTIDYLGQNSVIFDPATNSDLSLDQHIHWLQPDALSRVIFEIDDSSGRVLFGIARLDSLQISAVPEPGTLALLATGLAGLGWSRRRQMSPPL